MLVACSPAGTLLAMLLTLKPDGVCVSVPLLLVAAAVLWCVAVYAEAALGCPLAGACVSLSAAWRRVGPFRGSTAAATPPPSSPSPPPPTDDGAAAPYDPITAFRDLVSPDAPPEIAAAGAKILAVFIDRGYTEDLHFAARVLADRRADGWPLDACVAATDDDGLQRRRAEAVTILSTMRQRVGTRWTTATPTPHP